MQSLINYRSNCYLIITLDCVHELRDTEDGVVVSDDQPLPVVGSSVEGEVSQDRLGLVAVPEDGVEIGT